MKGTCVEILPKSACVVGDTSKRYTKENTFVILMSAPCYHTYQCLGNNKQPECDDQGNNCHWTQTGQSGTSGTYDWTQRSLSCEVHPDA